MVKCPGTIGKPPFFRLTKQFHRVSTDWFLSLLSPSEQVRFRVTTRSTALSGQMDMGTVMGASTKVKIADRRMRQLCHLLGRCRPPS